MRSTSRYALQEGFCHLFKRLTNESAEFPTDVKEVLTLLVKSRWLISNAKGVRVTRDMGSVSLAFERCVSARFSARF